MMRVLTIVVLASAAAAWGEDWAQWRGPDRSGHVPAGVAAPTALPDQVKMSWHFPVGFGLSSPVVAGKRVFHLDNVDNKEVIHALDADSGKELWSAALDAAFKDSQSAAGPRCTPTADGDRVYAQSCRGELACFNAADGKMIWRVNFVKDFGAVFIGESGSAEGASRHGNDGSPIIDGDHLIAQVGGRNGASIVCFDKLTGKVVWKSQNDVPGYASPIIASIGGVRQLISFTVEGVIGLNAKDGALLWRHAIKTRLGRHVTTPVVAGDMVVVASHQAGLVGIKISKEGDAFKAERAWAAKESAINFASPVVAGEHLYGVGPARNILCVDLRTGKQNWSKDGLIGGTGGNAYAGMLVMGKNVLMLNDRGELILFAADPTGFKEISRLQVCGQNWCTPAYAGGRIYLRDSREIYCVKLMP